MRRRKPGHRTGVLTFANHPASHLRPGTEPELLSTPLERLTRFGEVGYEECFFVPFDERIATLAPGAFLDLVVSRLHVRSIAVGETFRFGHGREGDVAFMLEHGVRSGVEVVTVPSACVEGERVSSTRIRSLVAAGELERADALLGAAYELRGTVGAGAGRGHRLGFPTANVCVDKLLPKDGVYSAIARYDGRDYAALVSIGKNPQFGDEARRVEVWLRDFRKTIYGRELAIRELRFVREQHAFASVEELTAQMRRDTDAVPYPAFM